jgi:hypothetical protein
MTQGREAGRHLGRARALLAWAVLPVSFVGALAALIRMAGPAADVPEEPIAIRLPGPVALLIVALFALAALVWSTHFLRRLSRRRLEDEVLRPAPEAPPTPAWLVAVTRIAGLLYMVAVAYLAWRGVIPLGEILALGQGAASGIGAALARPVPPSASPAVTWTFGILALATGLGALALAVWVAFGDHLTRWWDGAAARPSVPGERAVEDPFEDLGAEPDPRRAIMRCYARFAREAAGARVERRPSWTPSEFMHEALRHRHLPRRALVTLTSLFELARFSDHALGPAERDRALRALDDIRAAFGPGPNDAAR